MFLIKKAILGGLLAAGITIGTLSLFAKPDPNYTLNLSATTGGSHNRNFGYNSAAACNCQIVTNCPSLGNDGRTIRGRFCGFEGFQRKVCCDIPIDGHESIQNHQTQLDSDVSQFYRNPDLYRNEDLYGDSPQNPSVSTFPKNPYEKKVSHNPEDFLSIQKDTPSVATPSPAPIKNVPPTEVLASSGLGQSEAEDFNQDPKNSLNLTSSTAIIIQEEGASTGKTFQEMPQGTEVKNKKDDEISRNYNQEKGIKLTNIADLFPDYYDGVDGLESPKKGTSGKESEGESLRKSLLNPVEVKDDGKVGEDKDEKEIKKLGDHFSKLFQDYYDFVDDNAKPNPPTTNGPQSLVFIDSTTEHVKGPEIGKSLDEVMLNISKIETATMSPPVADLEEVKMQSGGQIVNASLLKIDPELGMTTESSIINIYDEFKSSTQLPLDKIESPISPIISGTTESLLEPDFPEISTGRALLEDRDTSTEKVGSLSKGEALSIKLNSSIIASTPPTEVETTFPTQTSTEIGNPYESMGVVPKDPQLSTKLAPKENLEGPIIVPTTARPISDFEIDESIKTSKIPSSTNDESEISQITTQPSSTKLDSIVKDQTESLSTSGAASTETSITLDGANTPVEKVENSPQTTVKPEEEEGLLTESINTSQSSQTLVDLRSTTTKQPELNDDDEGNKNKDGYFHEKFSTAFEIIKTTMMTFLTDDPDKEPPNDASGDITGITDSTISVVVTTTTPTTSTTSAPTTTITTTTTATTTTATGSLQSELTTTNPIFGKDNIEDPDSGREGLGDKVENLINPFAGKQQGIKNSTDEADSLQQILIESTTVGENKSKNEQSILENANDTKTDREDQGGLSAVKTSTSKYDLFIKVDDNLEEMKTTTTTDPGEAALLESKEQIRGRDEMIETEIEKAIFTTTTTKYDADTFSPKIELLTTGKPSKDEMADSTRSDLSSDSGIEKITQAPKGIQNSDGETARTEPPTLDTDFIPVEIGFTTSTEKYPAYKHSSNVTGPSSDSFASETTTTLKQNDEDETTDGSFGSFKKQTIIKSNDNDTDEEVPSNDSSLMPKTTDSYSVQPTDKSLLDDLHMTSEMGGFGDTTAKPTIIGANAEDITVSLDPRGNKPTDSSVPEETSTNRPQSMRMDEGEVMPALNVTDNYTKLVPSIKEESVSEVIQSTTTFSPVDVTPFQDVISETTLPQEPITNNSAAIIVATTVPSSAESLKASQEGLLIESTTLPTQVQTDDNFNTIPLGQEITNKVPVLSTLEDATNADESDLTTTSSSIGNDFNVDLASPTLPDAYLLGKQSTEPETMMKSPVKSLETDVEVDFKETVTEKHSKDRGNGELREDSLNIGSTSTSESSFETEPEATTTLNPYQFTETNQSVSTNRFDSNRDELLMTTTATTTPSKYVSEIVLGKGNVDDIEGEISIESRVNKSTEIDSTEAYNVVTTSKGPHSISTSLPRNDSGSMKDGELSRDFVEFTTKVPEFTTILPDAVGESVISSSREITTTSQNSGSSGIESSTSLPENTELEKGAVEMLTVSKDDESAGIDNDESYLEKDSKERTFSTTAETDSTDDKAIATTRESIKDQPGRVAVTELNIDLAAESTKSPGSTETNYEVRNTEKSQKTRVSLEVSDAEITTQNYKDGSDTATTITTESSSAKDLMGVTPASVLDDESVSEAPSNKKDGTEEFVHSITDAAIPTTILPIDKPEENKLDEAEPTTIAKVGPESSPNLNTDEGYTTTATTTTIPQYSMKVPTTKNSKVSEAKAALETTETTTNVIEKENSESQDNPEQTETTTTKPVYGEGSSESSINVETSTIAHATSKSSGEDFTENQSRTQTPNTESYGLQSGTDLGKIHEGEVTSPGSLSQSKSNVDLDSASERVSPTIEELNSKDNLIENIMSTMKSRIESLFQETTPTSIQINDNLGSLDETTKVPEASSLAQNTTSMDEKTQTNVQDSDLGTTISGDPMEITSTTSASTSTNPLNSVPPRVTSLPEEKAELTTFSSTSITTKKDALLNEEDESGQISSTLPSTTAEGSNLESFQATTENVLSSLIDLEVTTSGKLLTEQKESTESSLKKATKTAKQLSIEPEPTLSTFETGTVPMTNLATEMSPVVEKESRSDEESSIASNLEINATEESIKATTAQAMLDDVKDIVGTTLRYLIDRATTLGTMFNDDQEATTLSPDIPKNTESMAEDHKSSDSTESMTEAEFKIENTSKKAQASTATYLATTSNYGDETESLKIDELQQTTSSPISIERPEFILNITEILPSKEKTRVGESKVKYSEELDEENDIDSDRLGKSSLTRPFTTSSTNTTASSNITTEDDVLKTTLHSVKVDAHGLVIGDSDDREEYVTESTTPQSPSLDQTSDTTQSIQFPEIKGPGFGMEFTTLKPATSFPEIKDMTTTDGMLSEIKNTKPAMMHQMKEGTTVIPDVSTISEIKEEITMILDSSPVPEIREATTLMPNDMKNTVTLIPYAIEDMVTVASGDMKDPVTLIPGEIKYKTTVRPVDVMDTVTVIPSDRNDTVTVSVLQSEISYITTENSDMPRESLGMKDTTVMPEFAEIPSIPEDKNTTEIPDLFSKIKITSESSTNSKPEEATTTENIFDELFSAVTATPQSPRVGKVKNDEKVADLIRNPYPTVSITTTPQPTDRAEQVFSELFDAVPTEKMITESVKDEIYPMEATTSSSEPLPSNNGSIQEALDKASISATTNGPMGTTSNPSADESTEISTKSIEKLKQNELQTSTSTTPIYLEEKSPTTVKLVTPVELDTFTEFEQMTTLSSYSKETPLVAITDKSRNEEDSSFTDQATENGKKELEQDDLMGISTTSSSIQNPTAFSTDTATTLLPTIDKDMKGEEVTKLEDIESSTSYGLPDERSTAADTLKTKSLIQEVSTTSPEATTSVSGEYKDEHILSTKTTLRPEEFYEMKPTEKREEEFPTPTTTTISSNFQLRDESINDKELQVSATLTDEDNPLSTTVVSTLKQAEDEYQTTIRVPIPKLSPDEKVNNSLYNKGKLQIAVERTTIESDQIEDLVSTYPSIQQVETTLAIKRWDQVEMETTPQSVVNIISEEKEATETGLIAKTSEKPFEVESKTEIGWIPSGMGNETERSSFLGMGTTISQTSEETGSTPILTTDSRSRGSTSTSLEESLADESLTTPRSFRNVSLQSEASISDLKGIEAETEADGGMGRVTNSMLGLLETTTSSRLMDQDIDQTSTGKVLLASSLERVRNAGIDLDNENTSTQRSLIESTTVESDSITLIAPQEVEVIIPELDRLTTTTSMPDDSRNVTEQSGVKINIDDLTTVPDDNDDNLLTTKDPNSTFDKLTVKEMPETTTEVSFVSETSDKNILDEITTPIPLRFSDNNKQADEHMLEMTTGIPTELPDLLLLQRDQTGAPESSTISNEEVITSISRVISKPRVINGSSDYDPITSTETTHSVRKEPERDKTVVLISKELLKIKTKTTHSQTVQRGEHVAPGLILKSSSTSRSVEKYHENLNKMDYDTTTTTSTAPTTANYNDVTLTYPTTTDSYGELFGKDDSHSLVISDFKGTHTVRPELSDPVGDFGKETHTAEISLLGEESGSKSKLNLTVSNEIDRERKALDLATSDVNGTKTITVNVVNGTDLFVKTDVDPRETEHMGKDDTILSDDRMSALSLQLEITTMSPVREDREEGVTEEIDRPLDTPVSSILGYESDADFDRNSSSSFVEDLGQESTTKQPAMGEGLIPKEQNSSHEEHFTTTTQVSPRITDDDAVTGANILYKTTTRSSVPDDEVVFDTTTLQARQYQYYEESDEEVSFKDLSLEHLTDDNVGLDYTSTTDKPEETTSSLIYSDTGSSGRILSPDAKSIKFDASESLETSTASATSTEGIATTLGPKLINSMPTTTKPEEQDNTTESIISDLVFAFNGTDQPDPEDVYTSATISETSSPSPSEAILEDLGAEKTTTELLRDSNQDITSTGTSIPILLPDTENSTEIPVNLETLTSKSTGLAEEITTLRVKDEDYDGNTTEAYSTDSPGYQLPSLERRPEEVVKLDQVDPNYTPESNQTLLNLFNEIFATLVPEFRTEGNSTDPSNHTTYHHHNHNHSHHSHLHQFSHHNKIPGRINDKQLILEISQPNASSVRKLPWKTNKEGTPTTEGPEVTLNIKISPGGLQQRPVGGKARALLDVDAVEVAKQLGNEISNVVNQLLLTTHDNFRLLPSFVECASASARSGRRKTRVLKFDTENYPWMARIGYREPGGETFSCAGTIISKRYILTSAYCAYKYGGNITEVLLESVKHLAEPSTIKYKYEVEEVIPHPEYDPISRQNDLALVRLSSEIEFNSSPGIKPICLPFEDGYGIWDSLPKPGNLAYLGGWGFEQKNQTKRIAAIQEAAVRIWTNENCTKSFQGDKDKVITSKNICAYAASDSNACRGDAGSPLMAVMTRHKIFFQIGVVSYGPQCGYQVPRVYTRVADYLRWILDMMEP